MSFVTAMLYGHSSVLCQNGFVGDHPDRMGPGDPEMPHAIRIRYDTTMDDGRISFSIGATRFALKSRPTSLEVSPNISPAPDDADAELKKSNAPLGLVMIEVPIWSVLKIRCPVMPHRMRIRHFTWYEATMFSFDTGTTLDDEKLICPYENEFALTGSIPLSISDSPLNALLPDG